MRATECFLSSATREVMPVASILGESGRQHDFPPGGGELTRRVMKLYRAAVDDYVAANEALSIFR